jgi:hypothetical protein
MDDRNDDTWNDDAVDAWDNESDDDASETVDCPHCGAEVYEDALRCPSCGEFISHSTSLFAGRPWWWIALGIAGVVAVILGSIVVGWGL